MNVHALENALKANNFATAFDAFHKYSRRLGVLPKKEFKRLVDLSSAEDSLQTHCLIKLMPYCPASQFTTTFNLLIRRLLDQNQPEHGLSFMREVQLANSGTIDLEYSTLEKLMLTAKYLGDVEFALSAVKTMQIRYTKLYSRTWGLFLSLVLETNNYSALEYIWNEAAIPGYIVLDDFSYTQMARIASVHGNMEMCNWAVIGITGRHRYFGTDPDNMLQLRIYLIEAAASNGLSKRKLEGSIRAACKFIVRMENDAGRVRMAQLPQLLGVLEDRAVLEYVEAMYDEMLKDSHAHEMVKLLFFNILLCHYKAPGGAAKQLELYHQACEHQVEFNEESLLMLVDLGVQLADLQFLQHIIKDSSSSRVAQRYKRALEKLVPRPGKCRGDIPM